MGRKKIGIHSDEYKEKPDDGLSFIESMSQKMRKLGISPIKPKTNPKKQKSESNAEKDEKRNKGKSEGYKIKAKKKTGPAQTPSEAENKATIANKNRGVAKKPTVTATGKRANQRKVRGGIGGGSGRRNASATPPKPTARPKGINSKTAKRVKEAMDTADYGNYGAGSRTPPKPTPNPKRERQLQKEANRSPAAIKARKEAYSKKNSLSGNSINNEQKLERKLKNKQFASGGGSRKNTSGSTDARKGVVTKALSKMFGDKRSKAEMVKTRKQNQKEWDDIGPDK